MGGRSRRATALASTRPRPRAALARVPRVPPPRLPRRSARCRCGEPDRRESPLRKRRNASGAAVRRLREGALMSRLRAICPDCRTYTAVALDGGYECHACGRTFAAGLIRVPRAWGRGGEAIAEAAKLPVPYPETA